MGEQYGVQIIGSYEGSGRWELNGIVTSDVAARAFASETVIKLDPGEIGKVDSMSFVKDPRQRLFKTCDRWRSWLMAGSNYFSACARRCG